MMEEAALGVEILEEDEFEEEDVEDAASSLFESVRVEDESHESPPKATARV